MNLLKEQIIIDLINRQFDGFLEKTADYKKLYPYDTDIFLIEGSYYFSTVSLIKQKKYL